MFAEDLAPFFSTDDFAVDATWQRGTAAPLAVVALVDQPVRSLAVGLDVGGGNGCARGWKRLSVYHIPWHQSRRNTGHATRDHQHACDHCWLKEGAS